MSLPAVSDIGIYLDEVNRFPLLSREEEFTLAERYYKDNTDLEAAEALVVANLRYVIKVAHEYANYGCKVADLIQEGNIGLMTAVKRFVPYKGYRLITYANWWIRHYMQEFIMKSRGLVKRSSKALKRRLFYKQSSLSEGGDGGDVAMAYHDFSLDSPIGSGGEGGLSSHEGSTHLDMLADPAPGQEEIVEVSESTAIVKGDVSSALALLNERELQIVSARYMSEEAESLQSLGDAFGISRERVRQLESGALKKLRKALGGSASEGLLSLPAPEGAG